MPGYLQDLEELCQLVDDRLHSASLPADTPINSSLSLDNQQTLPSREEHGYINDLNPFKSLSTTGDPKGYLSDLLLLNESVEPIPRLSNDIVATASSHTNSPFRIFTIDDFEASYKGPANASSPEVSRDTLSDLLLLNTPTSINHERQRSPPILSESRPSSESVTVDNFRTSYGNLSTSSTTEVSQDTLYDLLQIVGFAASTPQNQSSPASNSPSSSNSVIFTTGDSNSEFNSFRTSSPSPSTSLSTSPSTIKPTMEDQNLISIESPNTRLRRTSLAEPQISAAMSTEQQAPHDFTFITPVVMEERPASSQINLNHQASTALAPRTTADVIADLKKDRIAGFMRLRPPKHQQTEHISGPQLQPVDFGINLPEHKLANIPNEEESEDLDLDQNDDDDSDSGDLAAVPKQRKMTERKHRLNSVAENYLQELNQKALTEGKKVSMQPEEEAQQSARWLVHQSENRQIISSPREYQIELFEKAKEKNVIAVLDTGSGKTLIAVLLLRHIFA